MKKNITLLFLISAMLILLISITNADIKQTNELEKTQKHNEANQNIHQTQGCYELKIPLVNLNPTLGIDFHNVSSCGFTPCDMRGGMLNSLCECTPQNSKITCEMKQECPENTTLSNKTFIETKNKDYELIIIDTNKQAIDIELYLKKYEETQTNNNYTKINTDELTQSLTLLNPNQTTKFIKTNQTHANIYIITFDKKTLSYIKIELEIQTEKIKHNQITNISLLDNQIIKSTATNKNIQDIENYEIETLIHSKNNDGKEYLLLKKTNNPQQKRIAQITFIEKENQLSLHDDAKITDSFEIQELSRQLQKQFLKIIETGLENQQNFIDEIREIKTEKLDAETKLIITLAPITLGEDYKNQLIESANENPNIILNIGTSQENNVLFQTNNQNKHKNILADETYVYIIHNLTHINSDEKTNQTRNNKTNYQKINITNMFNTIQKEQITENEFEYVLEAFKEEKKSEIRIKDTIIKIENNQIIEQNIQIEDIDRQNQNYNQPILNNYEEKYIHAELFLEEEMPNKVDDDALFRMPTNTPIKLMLWTNENKKIQGQEINYKKENICAEFQKVNIINATITSKDAKDTFYYGKERPLNVQMEENCYFSINNPYRVYNTIKIGNHSNRNHALYEIKINLEFKEEGMTYSAEAKDELRFWTTRMQRGVMGEGIEHNQNNAAQDSRENEEDIEEKQETEKTNIHIGNTNNQKIQYLNKIQTQYKHKEEKEKEACHPNNINEIDTCRKQGGEWYEDAFISINLNKGFKGLNNVPITNPNNADKFFMNQNMNCYQDTSTKDECGQIGQKMCAQGCLKGSPCGEEGICQIACEEKTNSVTAKSENGQIELDVNGEEIQINNEQNTNQETLEITQEITTIDEIILATCEDEQDEACHDLQTVQLADIMHEEPFIEVKATGINCDEDATIILDLQDETNTQETQQTKIGEFILKQQTLEGYETFLKLDPTKTICEDSTFTGRFQLNEEHWNDLPEGMYSLGVRIKTNNLHIENIEPKEISMNWGFGTNHLIIGDVADTNKFCAPQKMPMINRENPRQLAEFEGCTTIECLHKRKQNMTTDELIRRPQITFEQTQPPIDIQQRIIQRTQTQTLCKEIQEPKTRLATCNDPSLPCYDIKEINRADFNFEEAYLEIIFPEEYCQLDEKLKEEVGDVNIETIHIAFTNDVNAIRELPTTINRKNKVYTTHKDAKIIELDVCENQPQLKLKITMSALTKDEWDAITEKKSQLIMEYVRADNVLELGEIVIADINSNIQKTKLTYVETETLSQHAGIGECAPGTIMVRGAGLDNLCFLNQFSTIGLMGSRKEASHKVKLEFCNDNFFGNTGWRSVTAEEMIKLTAFGNTHFSTYSPTHIFEKIGFREYHSLGMVTSTPQQKMQNKVYILTVGAQADYARSFTIIEQDADYVGDQTVLCAIDISNQTQQLIGNDINQKIDPDIALSDLKIIRPWVASVNLYDEKKQMPEWYKTIKNKHGEYFNANNYYFLNQNIVAIILHTSATNNFESVKNTFLNPQSKVSAHFVIDLNGDIHQFVPINRPAWTVGSGNSLKQKENYHNLNTLNIEIVGIETRTAGGVAVYNYDWDMTDEQKESLLKLVIALQNKYDIPTNEILSHADVAYKLDGENPKNYVLDNLRALAMN